MSPLAPMKARVRKALQKWSEGNVILLQRTETSEGPLPDGEAHFVAYLCDAVVRGGAQYTDGTEVVSVDYVVVMAPQVKFLESDHESITPGTYITVVPTKKDRVIISEKTLNIKRVEEVPVGNPAKYRLFVAV